MYRVPNIKLSMLGFIAAIAAAAVSPQPSLAAEQWSEAAYTEVWSEAGTTDNWSTPEYTDRWSDSAERTGEGAEPNEPHTSGSHSASAQPALYIQLQIGSTEALVNKTKTQIPNAPIKIDGHTMVPFRFLGDALHADVGWDQAKKMVTLTLGDRAVELIIGQPEAKVNGKSIALTTPAVVKSGSTLVPLRFVTENLDLYVNYIAADETIEISDRPFAAADDATGKSVTAPKPASGADAPKAPSEQQAFDIDKLYGTWYIWTAGSVTNLYDADTGNYATHEYTQGAEQGKVVINKDGTYQMTHAAWGRGETVTGKWRLTLPNEMTVDGKTGIVLLDGITDVNWNIHAADNGKIQLRYAMTWSDGTVTWIHDSELYQK